MWESRPVNSVRHREVQIWKVKYRYLQSWLTTWFVQGMEVMHFTLAWRSFNNFVEKRWNIHLKIKASFENYFQYFILPWAMKFKAAYSNTHNWNGEKLPLASCYWRPCKVFFAVKCWGKNAIHTCSITVTVFAFYDIRALPLDKKTEFI